MDSSWVPSGGVNKFQQIKAWRQEAVSQGMDVLNLAIGQPSGPALLSARQAASQAVLVDSESMHEYQDNGSPGIPEFARDFALAHVPSLAHSQAEVAYLPIPGIKPMLGLVMRACGQKFERFQTDPKDNRYVGMTTKPGYPTPRDQAEYYRLNHEELGLDAGNEFRFSPQQVPSHVGLIMMNYPHNPTGQIATRRWLEALCEHCIKHSIRLFNDGAYALLTHSPEASTLTEVAVHYPDLSWAEAFSASKISNMTGWRVGAMVGSPGFIGDIARIKGNTDSGFFAPAAAGALAAVQNDRKEIESRQQVYAGRLQLLTMTLEEAGLKLAVMPRAGFFTLWLTPKSAFGEEIKSAEQFNRLMIERSGIVGVHFEPYMRYAVTSDEAMVRIDEIRRRLLEAEFRY